jgi:hypothetical protein
LIQIGRDEHLDSIQAYLLRENFEMRGLVEKLGFRVGPPDEDGVHPAFLDLKGN